MPRCCAAERPQTTTAMPVPAMSQPVDHQKRFQAAVDVIHNLPKDGSYRPSYEVMLRFYSLYKQAVCGACKASRPGFWDPVGRYKWDAWSQLGAMSSENAMAEYVEEMKKVAQEVIDTVPMNEKTASVFHHFEPLYVVIHDMPRPPPSLLTHPQDIKDSDRHQGEAEEDGGSLEDPLRETPAAETPTAETPAPETPAPEQEISQAQEVPSTSEHQVMSEGAALTSDSESEIFCDSVDSVELLDDVKAEVPAANGFHNGHAHSERPAARTRREEAVPQATQVGAGQGGEGADDGKGPPMRRSRDAGREGTHHGWRERGAPPGSPRRADRGGPGSGGGGGASRGGGDGSEGGPRDAQVQQQIVLALRRLREDMRSVMDRLEVVERLAAAHAPSADWRPCPHCAASNSASESEDEKWWPFDVSGRTVLLLLLWPFAAQGLMFLLRRAQRKTRVPV